MTAKPTTIRLSAEVRERLDAWAKRDRRSFNAELEILLIEAMDARERQEASQTTE